MADGETATGKLGDSAKKGPGVNNNWSRMMVKLAWKKKGDQPPRMIIIQHAKQATPCTLETVGAVSYWPVLLSQAKK
jgi:hypothetical protein